MADQAFATLNGYAVAELTLHVSENGVWFAEVDLENAAPALPLGKKAIKLAINGTTLVGTVDPKSLGTFGQAKHCRVVAGAGGWLQDAPRHGYANDAAVKCRTIADDAAKVAGETIGTFAPPKERLGAHYARQAGVASIALDDVAAGGVWWVDYAGMTHVAKERPTAKAAADTYEVQAFNPRTRVLELGVTGLQVGVGSIITERLEQPETIRAFTLRLSGRALTLTAVCGDPQSTNQLSRIVRAIVERVMNGWLFGKYRYRVVSMSPDGRVNVQAVSKTSGVPDLLRVEQWPGAAGAHAELAIGAVVVVEFLEGRRDLPALTAFAGKQSPDFVPERLTFGAKNPSEAANVAYQGSQVELLFPPMIVSGTMLVAGVPTPFTGVGAQPTGKLIGVVTVGTPKVRVGTS